MTRVIGPPRSRRRHWIYLWCLVAALGVGMVFISGAQAVHDTGTFQLDGDASHLTQPPSPYPQATDDWDMVCHQYASPLPAGGCGTTSDTTGSTAGSWASDGDLNATIFVGGGSKDPQLISDWAWKDGAGGLPDKDNLLHAYAVRYSLDASTAHCPNGTDPFDSTVKCDVIYFGLDRLDNSGDAQNGFWFLQSKVALGSNKIGGATGFTGAHVNGDVLVISDFSNGGTTSTITVLKWDTACTATNKPDADCADANLRQLETSANAQCSAALATPDEFCGLVNSGTITMPWSFTDKSGTPSNGALNGEFYEAGINLSTLGLAGECFSSVVSETRSSTSTTATLKDFVLGQFPTCKPTLTTQASETTTTAVLPGHAVHDTATINVSGGTNPPDPTGTVTFAYCFNATAVPTCGTTGLTSAGTGLLGDENHDGIIDDTTPNDGVAKALSDDVNTSTNPLAPGYYCFRASWPGDTNYPGALSFTDQSSECFRVKDTSSVATHQIWLPNDKATVTSAGGTALNGTVKFVLYSGGTCSGTQLWPTATDPAGTGEFPLTNATGGTTGTVVGPTTNTAVTVEADATVSWKVTFTSSDGGVDSPTTATCEVSTLDLTPNQ